VKLLDGDILAAAPTAPHLACGIKLTPGHEQQTTKQEKTSHTVATFTNKLDKLELIVRCAQQHRAATHVQRTVAQEAPKKHHKKKNKKKTKKKSKQKEAIAQQTIAINHIHHVYW
jgi:preprotein translocase subunit SecF